jgi:hypothetical protein
MVCFYLRTVIATLAFGCSIPARAASAYSIVDLGQTGALAINDRGQVLEASLGFDKYVFNQSIYQNGSITVLPSSFFDAWAINNAGEVVGNTGPHGHDDNLIQLALYSGGVVHTLSGPMGLIRMPLAIRGRSRVGTSAPPVEASSILEGR